jgi:hypothetical protein
VDTDKGGNIDQAEFREMDLTQFGLQPQIDHNAHDTAFAQIDLDGAGTIDLREFCTWLGRRHYSVGTRESRKSLLGGGLSAGAGAHVGANQSSASEQERHNELKDIERAFKASESWYGQTDEVLLQVVADKDAQIILNLLDDANDNASVQRVLRTVIEGLISHMVEYETLVSACKARGTSWFKLAIAARKRIVPETSARQQKRRSKSGTVPTDRIEIECRRCTMQLFHAVQVFKVAARDAGGWPKAQYEANTVPAWPAWYRELLPKSNQKVLLGPRGPDTAV